jgi:hypothetical protein
MDETFYCSYCFQPNSLFIDPSGGSMQSYVEDCQVCCRPNILFIQWQDEGGYFEVNAEPES